MNIKSSLTTAAAIFAVAFSFSATAHAKISITGHAGDYTQVADAYQEPVCKFVKVKFVKEQYGRKIVSFKTRKVCA